MILKIAFLCTAGFIAAFVDSIAGGGGLISLPAFFMAGIDPHFALGTNKFAASSGSFTSALKFARSGKVNFEVLKMLIPFTLIGSALGVQTVLLIDETYLQAIVLVMILFVGIYSLFSKSIGGIDKYKGTSRKNIIYGVITAFTLGFYDGFFGPGTGSFLVFLLIAIFGFDFVKASGNARVLNFVSNITALIMFAFHGQVKYFLGLPVAVAMIIGARMGTKVALKNGVKIIKPIFIIMSLAVAGKMLYQILF